MNAAHARLCCRPIIVPLLCILLLVACRRDIRDGRSTNLSVATRLLHYECALPVSRWRVVCVGAWRCGIGADWTGRWQRAPKREKSIHAVPPDMLTKQRLAAREPCGRYRAEVYFWEMLSLAQRLLLTGYACLIPNALGIVRVIIGLFVSIVFSSLLIVVQPYKRPDLNSLAVVSSSIQTCAFFAAVSTSPGPAACTSVMRFCALFYPRPSLVAAHGVARARAYVPLPPHHCSC